ncbi:MAG: alpha/beta fold hydrolase [Nocardioides sp.]
MRLPTHLMPTRLTSRTIGHLLGGTTDLASDWLARRRGVPEMVVPPGDWIELPGRGRTWLTDTGPRDGRPVILLHAIGCTGMLTWFPTVAELSRTHRVIVFDQRWHGRGLRSARFALTDCADDVAAVIGALGLEQPIVAGYSMGGVIAQRTWRQHPELIGGLVLAATSDHFRVTAHELAFHEGVELAGKALRMIASPTRRGTADPVAATAAATAAAYTAEQVGRWAIREFLSTGPLTVAQALGVLGRHHSTPWLELVDVPTAVVITTRDELIPAGRQRGMASLIPGATVHEAEVGHGGCVLEAATFVPVMLAAIASVQARLERRDSEQCG